MTTSAAAQEWSECFGSMDEDIHSEVTAADTAEQAAAPTQQPGPSAPGAAVAAAKGDAGVSLCVLQPDWCLRVDEVEGDGRDVQQLRVQRACQLYAAGRQEVVKLDVLARCHSRMSHESTALRYLRQVCALRPSVHSLLLLNRWLAQQRISDEGGGVNDGQFSEREAALVRCIDLSPVHVEAWQQLGELFLARAAQPSCSPSPSSPLCRCSRRSHLHSSRLCFELVRDLTNFTLQLPRQPNSHSSLPSLAHSQYPAWLHSAEKQLEQLTCALGDSEEAAPLSPSSIGCSRCAAVCPACWRGRLHRLACGPLLSLFEREKLAEQRPTQGARRGKDRRKRAEGREEEQHDGEEEGEGETTVHVDDFDALNL